MHKCKFVDLKLFELSSKFLIFLSAPSAILLSRRPQLHCAAFRRRGGAVCGLAERHLFGLLVHGQYDWLPRCGFGGLRHCHCGHRSLCFHGEAVLVAPACFVELWKFHTLPATEQVFDFTRRQRRHFAAPHNGVRQIFRSHLQPRGCTPLLSFQTLIYFYFPMQIESFARKVGPFPFLKAFRWGSYPFKLLIRQRSPSIPLTTRLFHSKFPWRRQMNR